MQTMPILEERALRIDEPEHATVGAPGRAEMRWVLALVLGLGGLISLVALRVFRPEQGLFQLANFVGPTTESLLHGGGLTVCTEALGTLGNPICFHAGRMPLASLTVALGIRLLGMRPVAVNVFKLFLFLLPLAGAVALVCEGAVRAGLSRRGQWLTGTLLLLPFGMTAFLADVVNMQVEEGYSYSLLALAVAMLLHFESVPGRGWVRAVVFAVAADGVYLSKSSMLLTVAVLLAGFCWLEKRNLLRGVAAVLVVSAPLGWAMHQHHASGRYSVGTSIDGMNLHKGNSAAFLKHYLKRGGDALDWHDRELNAGLHVNDEWSFNDYHARAAVAFMRSHPREELDAEGRKLWVILVSVHKLGSSDSHGALKLAEIGGLVIFRVLLWVAIGGAVWTWVRGRRAGRAGEGRAAAIIFLGLVAAVALPYVAGFAYTRHVSVLIYPAAMMCCCLLRDGTAGATS